MNDRPTVGLTFFLREKESIWNNGGAQNCIYLLNLLRACPGVGEVIAVNAGEARSPDKALMLEGLGIDFVPIEQAADKVDVLIEGAAQISSDHAQRVHLRGGRVIGFKFGNSLAIETERVIHKKKSGAIINGTHFDEIWTNPQHVDMCASYWETVYRCPVRVLPHIWMSTFIDKAIQEFPSGAVFGYRPLGKARRIGIFEPNINLVKTSVIPMLACELAFRTRPDLIDHVYVTNSIQLKGHLTFEKLACSLDIVRSKTASFEGRFNTPWFLAKHCDVMLCHQWENALNYAYYDALYGGYPLIHNSPMLPEGVGYRYDGFSAHQAAGMLLEVALHHDANRVWYERRAAQFLKTVHALYPPNVAAYEHALFDVIKSKAAA